MGEMLIVHENYIYFYSYFIYFSKKPNSLVLSSVRDDPKLPDDNGGAPKSK